MGEYLVKHGYKVKIANIAERMLDDKEFDVEDYIKNMEVDIFGIDLHWCVHSHGAIEIAKICKKYHTSSFIVLGGMTASVFYLEILENFPFVDAIIRGESEEPMLFLATAIEKKQGDFTNIPNLVYRKDGKIQINEMTRPRKDIDALNFTRLDLVEPKGKLLPFSKQSGWLLPVCRGCTYNCVTCGGSRYSYLKYFYREKPAFRNPYKLIEDLNRLNEQQITSVFLFQDIRMGGKKYVQSFIKEFREEKVNIENLTIELFSPASKEFLKELTSLPVQKIYITISPESGVDYIRKNFGRHYSTLELIKFEKHFKKIHDERLVLTNFFMIGLMEENEKTIRETWKLWDKLLEMNKEDEDASVLKPRILAQFDILVFLDPGSLAFDFPEKYGYKLILRRLQEYRQAMLSPSWKYWFSYETKYLNRNDLVKVTLNSWKALVELYKKHDLITEEMEAIELSKIETNRIIIKELDKILRIKDSEKQKNKLQNLWKAINDNGTVSLPWLLKKMAIDALNKLRICF
jgi:B12-binding domain/radical SAM domain protein